MPEQRVPKELRRRVKAVTNKRARFVLDSIVKNGIVTTEDINHAGYEHPPRAVRDARELGFQIKTIKVKHSNGRSIAAYVFDDTQEAEASKSGRVALPKKQRDEILRAAGNKCQVCGAEHNLQVDHRIPYEVAGEALSGETQPYEVLCGSCNRKKSWSCEHCRNWSQQKAVDVCRSCYWAEPVGFTHVAMQQQRRVELVWSADEVQDFDQLRKEAECRNLTVQEVIKERIKER